MAITSNIKNFRIVGGTTLIKEARSAKEGGEDGLGKWVKAMISSSTHKELKKLAIDEDVSLGRLLQEAIKNLLTKQKEKENGKG